MGRSGPKTSHSYRVRLLRIYLILEWCCAAPLAVMPGRAAPLGVEIDAVVVRCMVYEYENLLD